MVDKIKQVMLDYNISSTDADFMVKLSERRGYSLSKSKMILDMAKKENKEKGIPIPAAVFKIESELSLNKMITKKKNLPKDRKDTQFITKQFTETIPGGREQFKGKNENLGDSIGFRITPTGKRLYLNPYGHVKKDEHFTTPKQFTPVYHHQKGETPSFRPLPKPRYYYFGLNGEFYARGHDLPPKDDPDYRINDAKNIPYLRTEVAYVRQASKHMVPKKDDDGKTIIGPDGNPIWVKDHGQRTIRVDYYVGNTFIKTRNINMDYEDDVKFNIMKGQELAEFLRNELYLFGNEYGDRNVWIYKAHKSSIEPSESEKKYKEYYELERKKKRKKAAATRKKIIKRKITKKPIKKCICKKRPIAHKKRQTRRVKK